MNLIPTQPNRSLTIDQLRRHFGMIPAERILLEPPPGTAREEDAYRLNEWEGRRCELVDGVLVEKAVGDEEFSLAIWFGAHVFQLPGKYNLGKLLGADGFCN